jgi:peroxiredoxin Q/BCP
MSTPNPGDVAPPLALPDENGTVRDLKDQRGRWTVVYFYPADDTAGCTTEACQFRDVNGDLQVEGATVWGISPQGAESHRRFKDKNGLTFPLLVDDDHSVADAYGAWGPKPSPQGGMKDGLIRSTVLVDPEGKVARSWFKVSADGHAAEVLAALRELRAQRGA